MLSEPEPIPKGTYHSLKNIIKKLLRLTQISPLPIIVLDWFIWIWEVLRKPNRTMPKQ